MTHLNTTTTPPDPSSPVLQDTVYKAPLISEFQQEQEEFIRNKAGQEQQSSPWSGYQDEGELREKILALSEDRRNFLRAPPQVRLPTLRGCTT